MHPNDALTNQFLEWVGNARSYAETIDAWRTSCPRLTIFEDALDAGLIERVCGERQADALVRVTDAGRKRLETATVTHAC